MGAGVVVSEVRYSAFGEMRYLNGETVTDLLYTGQKLEEELGLYYYVARWYDSALGRFIQADTMIPDPGSSTAYDRYAYVQNNPINFSDPSGHFSDDQLEDWYGEDWKEELRSKYSIEITMLLMSDNTNLGDVVAYQENGQNYGAIFAEDEEGNLVMWDLKTRDQKSFDQIYKKSITGFYDQENGNYKLTESFSDGALPKTISISQDSYWGDSIYFRHDICVSIKPEVLGIAGIAGGTLDIMISGASPLGWILYTMGVIASIDVQSEYKIIKIYDPETYPGMPNPQPNPGKIQGTPPPPIKLTK